MKIGENEKIAELLTEQLTFPSQPVDETKYRNSTYFVISRVAYLIGVPKAIFENPHSSPELSIYEQLDENKNARILRNLCMIRTGLIRYFRQIGQAMTYDLKNIDSLPEYIPPECAKQLWRDGVQLLKANYKPEKYITDINRLLPARADACKELFPIWLNWDYIRMMFLMPKGETSEGAKRAHAEYHKNPGLYPYQAYINWPVAETDGNILYSDKKFVTLLYEKHENFFQDIDKVTDASYQTKHGIYDFIAGSQGTVLVVDCENSDPYKLYAVLSNLERDQLSLVRKIILFDDPTYTPAAWQLINEFTEIPVEHMALNRLKNNKSLVDMTLGVMVTKEFYQNTGDSFVIVSSDSDYWALITALPEARYLVMVEYDKCGRDLTEALENRGIFYCFIDDFCSGNSDEIKRRTLLTQIQARLDAAVDLNVHEMLRQVLYDSMVEMSEREKKQFYDRYIKPMKVVIGEDGALQLRLGGS